MTNIDFGASADAELVLMAASDDHTLGLASRSQTTTAFEIKRLCGFILLGRIGFYQGNNIYSEGKFFGASIRAWWNWIHREVQDANMGKRVFKGGDEFAKVVIICRAVDGELDLF